MYEFDPRWYRRAFHTFGACLIGYYLLPDVLWVNILKKLVVLIVMVVLISTEILRLRGKIKTEVFFGLRLYEQKRICSYLYFGLAASVLLLFFPQYVAVPCILAGALVDPVMGELRRIAQRWVPVVFGGGFSFGLFMICNYSPIPALFAAVLVVMGEVLADKYVDDDFLMQFLPAVGLMILAIFYPGAVPPSFPPLIDPMVMP